MDKDQVKAEIVELKALRKQGTQENHDRVIAYRACATSNKAIGAKIKELEASIRETKTVAKLESMTVAQVEQILADLKAKSA